MARKLYATVNNSAEPVVLVRSTPAGPWELESGASSAVRATGPGSFTVEVDGRNLKATVIKSDPENNLLKLRIAGRSYTVSLQDDRAHLIQALGLDALASTFTPELKAPMPGLVLDIMVQVGDVIKKNDPLLVLEAMKMENVIKSPGDVRIAQVHAKKGAAVEKGQLLLILEPK